MPLTVASTGLGCALDCLLDAPWLGPRLGLSLGRALACSLECFGAQSAQGRTRGEVSLVLFLGMSSFCLTGTKIPNVVGFGTFPNVVGFPSLRAMSRIRIVSCAFYGGGLDRALHRKGPDCALDCLLDWLGTRLGSPLRIALRWGGPGESSLGPFLNVA